MAHRGISQKTPWIILNRDPRDSRAIPSNPGIPSELLSKKSSTLIPNSWYYSRYIVYLRDSGKENGNYYMIIGYM